MLKLDLIAEQAAQVLESVHSQYQGGGLDRDEYHMILYRILAQARSDGLSAHEDLFLSQRVQQLITGS